MNDRFPKVEQRILSAAEHLDLETLINPRFTLAPGVELKDRRTWRKESRYTESDYPLNDGFPEWTLTQSDPRTPQRIRAYLIDPTPDQVRKGDQYDVVDMQRLIRDFAINGQDEPLWCSSGENGRLLISSGHRRFFAGVNADIAFFNVRLFNSSSSLDHLENMIRGNEFRKDLTPVQRGLQFVNYLTEIQTKFGLDISAQHGIDILTSKFNVTQEDALNLLKLTLVHPQVRAAVEREIITMDDAVQIYNENPDPKNQVTVLEKFVRTLPTDKTIRRISGNTRRDGSGAKGQPPAVKQDFSVEIPGTNSRLKVKIQCPEELTPEQIKAALEKVIESYGLQI